MDATAAANPEKIDKGKWQLFFPAPMDDVDKGNLDVSDVKRVQMFLATAVALPQQLDYLASKGVRLTVRIEEPSRGQEVRSYYNPTTHADILQQIDTVKGHIAVEAAIIGNEPEFDYDLTWQSSNWGNNPDQWFPKPGGKAQAHADAVCTLGPLLRAHGIAPVSPGWSHKRITPRDPAQPGRASWRELTGPAYNAMVANGVHLYAHDWASPEDENRYLWAAGHEVERCHQAVWVNETNVNSGSAAVRMQAVLKMAALLRSVNWESRIVSFCPFVSNGLGNSYKPGYIMRDPECYQLLRAWT